MTYSSLPPPPQMLMQHHHHQQQQLPQQIIHQPPPPPPPPPYYAPHHHHPVATTTNGPPPHLMTAFNSKLSLKSLKKHVCNVCGKRFTRPSSLQTSYSHTGEKPFKCDFDGCGRHFSVVSNLRRHKKTHKAQLQ